MTLIVRIGQVVLEGQGTGSGHGFILEPNGYKGLEDGVDIRREAVDRPQAHGSFDTPGFLDSRIVSLSGNAIAESPEKLKWMRSQITGLLANGDSAAVAVTYGGETLWGTARLASKTKWDPRGASPRTSAFQIQLWFANPRLFGESRTFTSASGTSFPIHHYGNFTASPVFTITGSMAGGYAIDGPGGKQFRVTAPLVSGQPHVVDMATGLLRVNGSIVFGAVTVGHTWGVPGGASVSQSVNPISGGTATVTATVFDTYI